MVGGYIGKQRVGDGHQEAEGRTFLFYETDTAMEGSLVLAQVYLVGK